MTDVFTPEKRSRIMARVKGADTRPEMIVRRMVHRMGYRFRLHRKDLPGKPDLTLPKHRKVIFVHGCFWHGHPGCPRAARPTTNTDFWNRKLSGNIQRDKWNQKKLREQGWDVLTVWGCETKDIDALAKKLRDFLERA